MPTSEEIGNDIQDLIKRTVADFLGESQKDSKRIFSRISTALKDLDLTKDGRIKPTIKNQKVFRAIEKQLGKDIITPAYLARLEEFTKGFDRIDKLQNLLYKELGETVKETALTQFAKTNAVELTFSSLTETGINQAIIAPIKKQLADSIATGARWSDVVENIRSTILDDKENLGILQRHITQIARDSLNQYHANRISIVADSLGMKWFRYSGGTRDTTREFCAKHNGEIFHESELGKLANESPWKGMIPGTNASNIRTNRGGFNCGHQFLSISKFDVPKERRDEFA